MRTARNPGTTGWPPARFEQVLKAPSSPLDHACPQIDMDILSSSLARYPYKMSLRVDSCRLVEKFS